MAKVEINTEGQIIEQIIEGTVARFNWHIWRSLQIPIRIKCTAFECQGVSEIVYIPTIVGPDNLNQIYGTCQECGRTLYADTIFVLS